jgi:hypothetical protein
MPQLTERVENVLSGGGHNFSVEIDTLCDKAMRNFDGLKSLLSEKMNNKENMPV